MASALTSVLAKTGEGFDRNLIKRGRSNDSEETQDSPFGSSLATPVDSNDIGVEGTSASESAALRFLVASRDTPITDYFQFKKKSGLPILSRVRDLSSGSNLTSNDLHDGSECINVGISRRRSMAGASVEDVLLRKKSIYNLPNSPIRVQAHHSRRSSLESLVVFSPMDDMSRCISEDNGTHISLGEQLLTTEDAFPFADEGPLSFLRPENFSSVDITASVTRVICFVPWCISVGGMMLLWPDKLELVAFEAGYVDSMQGIRRFAHWADVGYQFVMIFLAFLATVLWALPVAARATLLLGFASRFVYVWQGFRLDYSVPLGTDDQQSLYLLATIGRDLMGGPMTLTKTEAGFVITP